MESSPDCQRRVISCSRCRKRKIKCDRKTPSCTQCLNSQVACVGHNVIDGVEVPRSIVPYLELEIARIERNKQGIVSEQSHYQHHDRNQDQQPGADNGQDIGNLTALTEAAHFVEQGNSDQISGLDIVIEKILQRSELQEMISATMPTGPTPMDLVARVKMGLTPSFILPVSRGGTSSRAFSTIPPRSHGTMVDCGALASLPSHVIMTLVKKYVQNLLPSMPFLVQSVLWRQTENVINSLGTDDDEHAPKHVHQIRPSYDHLIVYIILAISATLGCAKSRHESRCMSFSEILFKEGIQHLCNEAPFADDLAGIQATLLVLQYAEINPKRANVWVLGGAAMRSCLELGLHREPSPKSFGLDPASLDLRRRIFWMAYCMDRTICSALQRPLSIPDPAINTQYPFLEPKDLATGNSVSTGAHEVSPAFHLIQYCRLQSIMIEVQFQGKPLDEGQTWDEWLVQTEDLLRRWHKDCQSIDEARAEFGLIHGLVCLHGPCPRTMRSPSLESLLIAFQSACDSARIYRERILYGFFRRPWLAAHHTARSAMVALYSFRHIFGEILERFSVGEIFEMMKCFTTNLLHISGQGWAEVTNFAARYERLLSPLLEALLAGTPPSAVVYPAEYDAELSKYFYPGATHVDYLQSGIQSRDSTGADGVGSDLANWDEGFAQIFEAMDTISWDWDQQVQTSLLEPGMVNFDHNPFF